MVARRLLDEFTCVTVQLLPSLAQRLLLQPVRLAPVCLRHVDRRLTLGQGSCLAVISEVANVNNASTTFAQALAEAREAKGLSQNALARALGMDASHLNRIERGLRNPPSREKVLAIAEVLELTPEEQTRLLVSAGFAPENVRGLDLFRSKSSETRKIDGIFTNGQEESLKRASPEVLQLIQQWAQAAISLLEDPALKPRDRRLLLVVLEASVTHVREIKHQVLNDGREREHSNDIVVTPVRLSEPEEKPRQTGLSRRVTLPGQPSPTSSEAQKVVDWVRVTRDRIYNSTN